MTRPKPSGRITKLTRAQRRDDAIQFRTTVPADISRKLGEVGMTHFEWELIPGKILLTPIRVTTGETEDWLDE